MKLTIKTNISNIKLIEKYCFCEVHYLNYQIPLEEFIILKLLHFFTISDFLQLSLNSTDRNFKNTNNIYTSITKVQEIYDHLA